MPPRVISLFSSLGALGLIAAVFFLIVTHEPTSPPITTQQKTATGLQTAAAFAGLNVPDVATSSPPASRKTPGVQRTIPSPGQTPPQAPAEQPTTGEVTRIANPYQIPPESFNTINAAARAALVNILCMPEGGSLSPISGSGVLIDPRGIILTNAHVAQYVLLSESQQVDLACVVRTGAPATAHYTAEVLYIPPIWVQEHAGDINTPKPLGTGEHDYALLLITGTTDGSALPSPPGFPSLPTDTREAIAFQGDQVLVGSYPAEFLGGIAAENDLYPVSSVTTISQLLTFSTTSVDLLSLGGVIEAQGGSSGGAVLNAWGRLVGLITTTSEGTTTSERDLRAITLSYVDEDLVAQTGSDLAAVLKGDVAAKAQEFKDTIAPSLIDQFVQTIENR